MKAMIGAVALALLSGCALTDGSGYVGPSRGIQGSLTTKYFDFRGVNTTIKDGEQALQATIDPDGTRTNMVSTYRNQNTGVEATGPAADMAALADLCRIAPRYCSGEANLP